jgi:hypothetical protein
MKLFYKKKEEINKSETKVQNKLYMHRIYQTLNHLRTKMVSFFIFVNDPQKDFSKIVLFIRVQNMFPRDSCGMT